MKNKIITIAIIAILGAEDAGLKLIEQYKQKRIALENPK
jgi:hypothetical protein